MVRGTVNLPIPEAQCPRVVFLSLGFKVFLDDSAIDDGFVAIRTLLASSLEEILRGLLLRHCQQQGAVWTRRKKGRGKEKIEKKRLPRSRRGMSDKTEENALKAYCETSVKTIGTR